MNESKKKKYFLRIMQRFVLPMNESKKKKAFLRIMQRSKEFLLYFHYYGSHVSGIAVRIHETLELMNTRCEE